MSKSGSQWGWNEQNLGPVPGEWDVGSLDKVLTSIDAGRSPNLPDRPAQTGEWGVLKVSAIRPDGLQESENKAVIQPTLIDPSIEVKHGDLLISRANTPALVGLACYVRKPRSGLMLSDKTLRLNIDSTLALPRYIRHLLQASFSRCQIETSGTGSSGSMKNISQDEIRSLILPLPGIQEQRKLTEILDTADEEIRATEQIIGKLEQIKRGLIHKLLTSGIQHAQNADPFVRIPEAPRNGVSNTWSDLWKPRSLTSCVDPARPITYGIVQAGPVVDDGVPYVRTLDLRDGGLALKSLLRTSQAIANEYRRSMIKTGDLICGIRATVGRFQVVPAELDGANISRGIARLAPASDVSSEFLRIALNSTRGKQLIAQMLKGSTFLELTLRQLGALEIPLPELKEQLEIVRRVAAFDCRITTETSQLGKLRLLKRGLMDDLLTGRVRVGTS